MRFLIIFLCLLLRCNGATLGGTDTQFISQEKTGVIQFSISSEKFPYMVQYWEDHPSKCTFLLDDTHGGIFEGTVQGIELKPGTTILTGALSPLPQSLLQQIEAGLKPHILIPVVTKEP